MSIKNVSETDMITRVSSHNLPLSPRGGRMYPASMSALAPQTLSWLPIVAVAALSAALLALGFASWLHFGDVIILTLSESGLRFCF